MSDGVSFLACFPHPNPSGRRPQRLVTVLSPRAVPGLSDGAKPVVECVVCCCSVPPKRGRPLARRSVPPGKSCYTDRFRGPSPSVVQSVTRSVRHLIWLTG